MFRWFRTAVPKKRNVCLGHSVWAASVGALRALALHNTAQHWALLELHFLWINFDVFSTTVLKRIDEYVIVLIKDFVYSTVLHCTRLTRRERALH